jgi:hypothetical protein
MAGSSRSRTTDFPARCDCKRTETQIRLERLNHYKIKRRD